MTADLIFRPIGGPDEIDLFNAFPGPYNDRLAEDLETGRRRYEWLWLALHDGRPVARVGWWSSRAGGPPEVLDTIDMGETLDGLTSHDTGRALARPTPLDAGGDPGAVDLAERLLRAAMGAVLPPGTPPPPCVLQPVPVDWRDDETAGRLTKARVEVVERTGGRMFVERLRYRWTAGTPLPEPSRRLTFREAGGDEETVALLEGILSGTLDAYSRADIARSSIEEYAREQYHSELLTYPSPREWWRVGLTPGGEPVGLVVPARNSYAFILAYIGVAEGHRGHGYVNDLLAEGTRLLAGHGATQIMADTDLANTPMSKAFTRAGYQNHARRLDLTWG
ncbi:GNAT family N-acetyltransferase [Sphaerisporangium album]|uniref:GNAT family N-acetyltransferase n=1 Tax=Sphaerisporangium album TaxID=509200 RepID=A0A367FHH5_9ACTN|nr:GNAT family N-acetyltransferase [Sphaerisporangium album]RCG29070.1 GNAT family N-acetyltransferase [Sphaerisporangium album]